MPLESSSIFHAVANAYHSRGLPTCTGEPAYPRAAICSQKERWIVSDLPSIGHLCKPALLVIDCDAVVFSDLTCFPVTSLELDFLLDIRIYCALCLFYLVHQHSIFGLICFIHEKHAGPLSLYHLGFQFCNFHTPLRLYVVSQPQNCLLSEGSLQDCGCWLTEKCPPKCSECLV